MEFNKDLSFPDGVGFYPDVRDGIRGYNTDAARGADTFVPFSSMKCVNNKTVTAKCSTASTSYTYTATKNVNLLVFLMGKSDRLTTDGIDHSSISYSGGGTVYCDQRTLEQKIALIVYTLKQGDSVSFSAYGHDGNCNTMAAIVVFEC